MSHVPVCILLYSSQVTCVFVCVRVCLCVCMCCAADKWPAPKEFPGHRQLLVCTEYAAVPVI